ncbi:MAG: IMP dehydrogenase [Phycisphaerales bacterium]|jgi:IMP dehydrogenase|nr:IMP dehydrogenase [Phycisphaerales bacterium]MBT7170726.1 IMP dehydrogenase [Phycisphaerales bacterium]
MDIDKMIDGITFDDVLLMPALSDVHPDNVDTSAQLTRRVRLNIPLVSAPMDTVTEAKLAISLAQEGGLGIIHRNLDIEAQAREVEKVKRSANGIILDPVTLGPDDSTAKVREAGRTHGVSGFPIVEPDGTVVGILTSRDMSFLTEDCPIRDVMTKDNLVTAPLATSLDEAKKILSHAKVEKLLLVEDGKLAGLVTMADIVKTQQFPKSCRDDRGRLRVGAAIGIFDYDRVEALVEKEVDVICIDTSHGHKAVVLETIREIKKRWDIDVIAGNIATADAARDLIEAGADSLRIGIGPGAICTTRVVTGVGVPQITAVSQAVSIATPHGVPVIADGGIRHSGDITKALAAGASVAMMGSLFAGMDESPGELVLYRGRRYKAYRGMGSIEAMVDGSADRYSQGEVSERNRLVPEGVSGRVPYRGKLADYVYQLVGGIRSGMDHVGAHTIEELWERARFLKVSSASLAENHPHDISITQESPNYLTEL